MVSPRRKDARHAPHPTRWVILIPLLIPDGQLTKHYAEAASQNQISSGTSINMKPITFVLAVTVALFFSLDVAEGKIYLFSLWICGRGSAK